MADYQMKFERNLRFTNSKPCSLNLIIEPWAEEYCISKGQVFEVHGVSDQDGDMELEISEGYLIVYAWAGAILQVYVEGEIKMPFT